MAVQQTEWLKRELSKLLGWDDFVIEGVVEAILNSTSRQEVQEIVENFMEGNKAASKLIDQFWANKGFPQTPAAPEPSGSYHNVGSSQRGGYTPSRPSSNASQSQAGPTSTSTSAPADVPAGYTLYNKRDNTDTDYMTSASVVRGKGKQKGSSTTTQPASQPPPVTASAPKVQMFPEKGSQKPAASHKPSAGGHVKQGGKVKKGGGVRREDQLLAAASQLEKKVVNCLGCGKIFDCRSVTNEIIKFLESGGICTFCGKAVSLSYSGGGRPSGQPHGGKGPAQNSQSSATGTSQAEAAVNGTSTSEPDEATAAAIAFKNRLVDFDRNAAKRTTVIDDQSDYFEIDSNSWLNEQEREQLRLQQQVEEEAEAARRRRVKVTLDLLGRQVLLADDDYRAQERAVADALSGRMANPANAVPDKSDAAGSMSMKAELNMVSHAQSEALKARTAASLRELKITANPAISTPPPVFLPAEKTPAVPSSKQLDTTLTHGKAKTKVNGAAANGTAKAKADGAAAGAAAAVPSRDKVDEQPQNATSKRAANRKARLAQRKINRIQDENVFDDFEADLILEAAASSTG